MDRSRTPRPTATRRLKSATDYATGRLALGDQRPDPIERETAEERLVESGITSERST
jgi:hypothetical protein